MHEGHYSWEWSIIFPMPFIIYPCQDISHFLKPRETQKSQFIHHSSFDGLKDSQSLWRNSFKLDKEKSGSNTKRKYIKCLLPYSVWA